MEQKMNLTNIDLGLAQNRRGKSFHCKSLLNFCVLSCKKMRALYFFDKYSVFGSVII